MSDEIPEGLSVACIIVEGVCALVIFAIVFSALIYLLT